MALTLLFAPRPARAVACDDIRDARSILIIKTDEIGDVVLATGFFAAIRAQCPRAKLSLMVRGMCAELVRDLGVADEILILPEPWREWTISLRTLVTIVRCAREKWGSSLLSTFNRRMA